ncbi:Predicted transglutaminase-like cysteine proteinase [Neptunomonas antarctica]|uniref:Predicted transglutaminase-like cysteine proteinase n=1 Tax=Neptunomonas antarctica TaxID=619304 RepID=A0A1N7KK47_9GAMM|nr:Predicted transglutaminase-like cysteine proteinase [Neptunomonas antarctica]
MLNNPFSIIEKRRPTSFKISAFCCLCVATLSLTLSMLALSEISVRLTKAYIHQLGQKYGAEAELRLQAWQNLMNDIANKPEKEKLKQVNDFFNQVRFLDDISHWKQKDYWATPVEFLISNGGDCEDFSIAKYYTLKEVGVDMNKLSISYVKALKLNQAHMVLTYYEQPNAIPVVLDNLIPEIKPASQRPDLLHVYSFNGDNLWLSKKGRRTTLVGTSDRLGPWVQLKSRLENNRVNVN